MESEKYALMAPVESKRPHSIDHMIAIDTEDDTKGNLKVACIYGTYLKRRKKGKEVITVEKTFYDRSDLCRFLHSLTTPGQDFKPCHLVGFNLSYDMPYFMEEVDFATVIMSGTRFIAGKLKNGIKMIDIFNHGGMRTLDHWITELNMGEKGIVKTEWRADMPLEELASHCQNDVKGHWEMAMFFRDTYKQIGVSFKSTTSSTALDLYKRQFMTDIWRREKAKFNDDERKAYYGGRTECFSRGIHHVKSYDINSAYVSVMATEQYPKPDTAQRFKSGQHFKHYYKDNENLMIVHCEVFAPKRRVMVLPYRDEESGKLLFPHGTFSGWWCSPELHEAEKYGYKILKVHEFIIYRTKGKYFENYANYTWQQRHIADAQGNGGMKTVWKLFGNGLYGKMAQRNPIGGGFQDVIPANVAEGSRPIILNTPDGIWYQIQSAGKEESINSFPCVSAFITCYTRLKLLKYLKRHEKDVIYCDTDSVKIPWDGEQEPSSKALGDVKFEDDQSGWYCFLKPKLYGISPPEFSSLPPDYDFMQPVPMDFMTVDTVKYKWKIKGAGKGGLGYFNFSDMTFHTQVKKPNRFKESIRRGLTINEWCERKKEMTLIDDKRNWLGKDSEPLLINESKDLLTLNDQ